MAVGRMAYTGADLVVRSARLNQEDMMGMVLCPTHGRQTGPSCCDHLTTAVYAGDVRLEFGMVEFDVMCDGTEMFAYYICAPCLRNFDLEITQTVSEEVWASKERFPNVGLVCGSTSEADWAEQLAPSSSTIDPVYACKNCGRTDRPLRLSRSWFDGFVHQADIDDLPNCPMIANQIDVRSRFIASFTLSFRNVVEHLFVQG